MSKFVKNSMYYSLMSIIPMIIGVFTLPVWAKYLTPEDLGDRSLILSFMSLLTIAGSLQVSSSVNRLYFDMETMEEKKRFYSSLLNLVFLLVIVYLFLVEVFHIQILDFSEFQMEYRPNFFYGVISALFNLLFTYTTAFFKVREKAKPLFVTTIVTIAIDLILKVYFIVFLEKGFEGYMLSMAITSGCTFVIHFFLLLPYYLPFHISLSVTKQAVSFGIPLIPHAFGGYLFMYSDKIVLTRFIDSGFVTKAMIGVYGIAEVFTNLFKVLVNSYAKAIMPTFMRACKKSEQLGARMVNMISREWFVFMGVLYFAFVVVQDPFIVLFARFTGYNDYLLAIELIPMLALAYVLRGIYILPINTYYFKKKTKFLPVITFASGVANVLLNFALIPYFGVFGAVIATVFSFLLNALFIQYFTKYTFRVNYNMKSFLVLGILVSIAFISDFTFSNLEVLLRSAIKFSIFTISVITLYYFDVGQFQTTSKKYIHWIQRKLTSSRK